MYNRVFVGASFACDKIGFCESHEEVKDVSQSDYLTFDSRIFFL